LLFVVSSWNELNSVKIGFAIVTFVKVFEALRFLVWRIGGRRARYIYSKVSEWRAFEQGEF